MVSIATIKSNIKAYLTANNTTTSGGLSEGLNSKVTKISGSNADKQPVMLYEYPIVFVEAKTKDNEFDVIGNTSKRDAEIEIDIVPVVDFGITQENAREESDDELITLTENIESLINNNINLSNTVLSVLVDEIEIESNFAENTYNSSARIKLLIKDRG